MIKLSKKDHDFGLLASDFQSIKFELFSSDELNFINCIACWFSSSQELATKWKEIQSIISLKFKPDGRFSRWNVYLVLLSPDTLDNRIKYIIENDRYAARKIVLDGLKTQISTEDVERKINVELLGADLKLQEIAPSHSSKVELSIAEIIKGTPIDTTNESKVARSKVITNLIEFYKKNEDKKS